MFYVYIPLHFVAFSTDASLLAMEGPTSTSSNMNPKL